MSLFNRSGDAARDTATDVHDRAEGAAERVEDTRTETDGTETAGTRGDTAAPEQETERTGAAGAASYRGRVADLGLDRASVLQREKDRYGGVKIGSAFFGWLAATGTGVLLAALVVGAGGALGVASNTPAGQTVQQATQNATAIGIGSGIALLCILFLAYYCGGYVAGRMARFDGAKQGVAVWVIAVLAAVVIGVLGVVTGKHYDVVGTLNNLPHIRIGENELAGGAVVGAVLAGLVTLIGAVLGGLAGMRYHRKIDRAGLGV